MTLELIVIENELIQAQMCGQKILLTHKQFRENCLWIIFIFIFTVHIKLPAHIFINIHFLFSDIILHSQCNPHINDSSIYGVSWSLCVSVFQLKWRNTPV